LRVYSLNVLVGEFSEVRAGFGKCNHALLWWKGLTHFSSSGLERRQCKAMYATVRRYEGVSDPSEVVRIVNEGFLPIIREIPGFVDYHLVDAGDGVLVSTSIFEDPSGLRRSRTGGLERSRGSN
jgi:hypothetical protein